MTKRITETAVSTLLTCVLAILNSNNIRTPNQVKTYAHLTHVICNQRLSLRQLGDHVPSITLCIKRMVENLWGEKQRVQGLRVRRFTAMLITGAHGYDRAFTHSSTTRLLRISQHSRNISWHPSCLLFYLHHERLDLPLHMVFLASHWLLWTHPPPLFRN